MAAKSTSLQGSSSFNTDLPNHPQALSANEDLTVIMELAGQSLWSDRVKFFDTIRLLLSSPRKNEVAQNLNKACQKKNILCVLYIQVVLQHSWYAVGQ